MVKVFSALAESSLLLRNNNFDTPRLDSEVLLAYMLGVSRLKLVTEGSRDLSTDEYEKFKNLIDRRLRGVPVAYIVGSKEFMGLNFAVRTGVLIPRPDTETVVERAIIDCEKHNGTIRVADVGCGSGAIGISIAKYALNSIVTMIDISDDAISVSKENANMNGVEGRINIIKGDLLSPVMGMVFDMVVSNPPYIRTGEISTLSSEVKDNEPLISLDGGEDGLKYYRKIAAQARDCIAAGGSLILEVGYDEAEDVCAILSNNNFNDLEVIKDLGGNDRCVVGKK